MDKYEARRRALKALVNHFGHGGIARIADRIDKAPNYVSRMLYEPGKPGRKRIGEDTLDALVEAYPEAFSSCSHGPVPREHAVREPQTEHMQPDEAAILELYRGMSEADRRAWEKVGNALAESTVTRKDRAG